MSSQATTAPETELATKILIHSKRLISRELPFLLPALYLMEEEPVEEPGPLSSNGSVLFYHPGQVVQDYNRQHNSVALQLLHIVCHGLLLHFSRRKGQLPEVFDPVADAKVRALMEAMGQASGKRYVPGERSLTPQARALAREAWHTGLEALYLSRSESRERAAETASAAPSLRMDDHSAWTRAPRKKNGGGDGGFSGRAAEEARLLWQEALSRVQQQMGQDHRWGTLAGMMTGEYEPAEENGVSYAEFLRAFAVPAERQLVDPDNFDRNWYHIGLSLYGDMPLVEYNELREDLTADDLVIALDTSGSCEGEVMRAFLRETLNLLRDISAGRSSFHITLLQCDAEIQAEHTLTERSGIDGLLTDFQPRGFGGTDFTPVFRRIEELRSSGTLRRIRGLLYLTDGFGSYPELPPDYPAAFLFPPQEAEFAEQRKGIVPDWITSVQLTEDALQIERGESE